MAVNGVLQDYGTLSARTIVTGTDGRAATVYTAPVPPPPAAGGSSTVVTIVATPTGSNFATVNPQIASIRLVPPGVILPPANTPTARFTFSSPVNVGSPVMFDGSSSCPRGVDAGGVCLPPSSSGATITNYAWSFGDGGSATGQTASHKFTSIGTFNVTLTVTNDRGVQGSSAQVVSTTLADAPSGDFTTSPSSPVAGDTVLFNADAIQAAPGHSIVQYSWDFGDPNGTAANNTASTSRASHVYTCGRVLQRAAVGARRYGSAQDVHEGGGRHGRAAESGVYVRGHRHSYHYGGWERVVGGRDVAHCHLRLDVGRRQLKLPAHRQSFRILTQRAGPNQVTLTVTDTLGRVGTTTQTVTVP